MAEAEASFTVTNQITVKPRVLLLTMSKKRNTACRISLLMMIEEGVMYEYKYIFYGYIYKHILIDLQL